MSQYHIHFIATLTNIKQLSNDPEWVNQWLRDLVDVAKMNILIPPNAVYCADDGNEGCTGTVVISTSHASIHIWDNPIGQSPYAKMDLYSCKNFDVNEVMQHCLQLSPDSVEGALYDRNGNLPSLVGTYKLEM